MAKQPDADPVRRDYSGNWRQGQTVALRLSTPSTFDTTKY